MEALIRKFGGEPFVAPSMREVPLGDNPDAIEVGQQLLGGGVDVFVFLTGVGASAMLNAMVSRFDKDRLIAAIDACRVCLRGPKPAVVMRQWGVHIDVRAPEPNTSTELLAAMDEAGIPSEGDRLVLQEYGEPNKDLAAELAKRGARVRSLCVYKWALPEDTGPLEQAVAGVAASDFDVFLVTSAQQIRHALQVARKQGLEDQFRAGLEGLSVGSIGPTATEALQCEGIRVDVEPEHPKMGPLVRAALAGEPTT